MKLPNFQNLLRNIGKYVRIKYLNWPIFCVIPAKAGYVFSRCWFGGTAIPGRRRASLTVFQSTGRLTAGLRSLVPCQSAVLRAPFAGHLTVVTADSVVRLNTYEAGIHTIAAFLDSCCPLWRAQASQEWQAMLSSCQGNTYAKVWLKIGRFE